MKKFRIEQNYTQYGTRYYEVSANSLDDAIERVAMGDIERYDEDIWDFESDYEDSGEIKKKGKLQRRVKK